MLATTTKGYRTEVQLLYFAFQLRDSKAGSAQETVETRHFGRLFTFGIYQAAAAVVVGMWKAAFCAGFPSSEGGDENVFTKVTLPPSERHFHNETPGFPASLSDFCFSDSDEHQKCALKKPV